MTHPKSQPDTNDAQAALEQIAVVCTDNMDRSCDHRMALDFVRQVANDYLDRAAPRCGVQTVQATRRQIAEAIADGWTNGNETYEAQNDIMRMRLDHAALAVLDLLASSPLPSADGGRDDG